LRTKIVYDTCVIHHVLTNKMTNLLWPFSDASCLGVDPLLLVTMRSSFVPAWARTVHASMFPPMAAQCKGVQPDPLEN
jgi:hypothetical protein